jgi:hypothetical protein
MLATQSAVPVEKALQVAVPVGEPVRRPIIPGPQDAAAVIVGLSGAVLLPFAVPMGILMTLEGNGLVGWAVMLGLPAVYFVTLAFLWSMPSDS